jgi:hypothetical protein
VPVVSQDEWKLPANSEEIKQEVIKDMQKVVLVSDEEQEKQKDAIIADYLNPNITLAQMLVKWHIQSTRWHVLRAKWNVPSKGRQGGNRKRTGTKPAKIETKTANPETPVAQRLDAISNHLGAMDLVLTNMDSSLNDLNNRGYMDEAMKADIVAAAIEYFTGPGITKEARGKKVLAIVQAIEGV